MFNSKDNSKEDDDDETSLKVVRQDQTIAQRTVILSFTKDFVKEAIKEKLEKTENIFIPENVQVNFPTPHHYDYGWTKGSVTWTEPLALADNQQD